MQAAEEANGRVHNTEETTVTEFADNTEITEETEQTESVSSNNTMCIIIIVIAITGIGTAVFFIVKKNPKNKADSAEEDINFYDNEEE